MLGRGGARKNCANSWMEEHAGKASTNSTDGKRFHVLRVKNRFDPSLDNKPECLNGGYRDINIKLKIGFNEGKNGRAVLMTVRDHCLKPHAAILHCWQHSALRWTSGRAMRQTIVSCVRCRCELTAKVCSSVFCVHLRALFRCGCVLSTSCCQQSKTCTAITCLCVT